jgi:hypothetical protein
MKKKQNGVPAVLPLVGNPLFYSSDGDGFFAHNRISPYLQAD